jgi:hypothetical protein
MAYNKPLTLQSSPNTLCTKCGDFNKKEANWIPENKFKINLSNFPEGNLEAAVNCFNPLGKLCG